MENSKQALKKVYISDNVLVFCTADQLSAISDVEIGGEQASAWFILRGDRVGTVEQEQMLRLTNLQQIFETAKSVAFVAESQAAGEAAFEIFAREFVPVMAAGGVVVSPRGEVLLIYRRGKWDLPKGKIEQGETPVRAAVREVEEECGITGLEPGRLLGETYHLYRLDGRWMLKQTHWYAMRHSGQGEPIPQLEEQITDIRWVPRDMSLLKPYLDISYPLVRDLLGHNKDY